MGDISVQHISDDIENNGGSNTSFTPVSSLTSAFELANCNRFTHAGITTLGSTTREGDDMAGGRVLTGTGTLTYYRESGSVSDNTRFETSIVKYTGSASGDNEFVVRGRYSVALNGSTTNAAQTVSGVSDEDKCVPFITGIMNDVTSDGADSATAIAFMESSTSLRVWKGSNTNNVTVYVTLVEFTGSNWTVLHGDSGSVSADTGTITLYDGADGTGTPTGVTSWANSFIVGQFKG